MIEFKRVNKYYGAHHVLRDVTLQVSKGEVVVICGPSGSGKSTLIKCVNALESYNDGEIVVDGVALKNGERPIKLLRRRVGMVFQNFELYPHLRHGQHMSRATCRAPAFRAGGKGPGQKSPRPGRARS